MSLTASKFIDTVVMDKISAIRLLLLRGYPLRHEVKGISKALVERIETTLAAESQVVVPVAQALAVHPQENIPVAPSTSTMPTIVVPRILWEGKSPEAVRDGMRIEGFQDAIIAYVLVEWCKVNKTKSGALLGPRRDNENDSTSRHRIYKLLKEAAAITPLRLPEQS